MKILCICAGNTCRSPLMEAILRDLLKRIGVEGIVVESAGTMKSSKGQSLHRHTLQVLTERRLSLPSHKARHIRNIGNLERFDLILCADELEAKWVRLAYRKIADRVQVMNAIEGGLPDPWLGDLESYRACTEAIEASLQEIIPVILSKRHPP